MVTGKCDDEERPGSAQLHRGIRGRSIFRTKAAAIAATPVLLLSLGCLPLYVPAYLPTSLLLLTCLHTGARQLCLCKPPCLTPLCTYSPLCTINLHHTTRIYTLAVHTHYTSLHKHISQIFNIHCTAYFPDYNTNLIPSRNTQVNNIRFTNNPLQYL